MHPEGIDWQTCILSLQHILGNPIHVGAATALRTLGFGHSLPLGEARTVWLFALEGGTAINLFYRDLSRVSVDIDLTFLPILNRDESMAAIRASCDRAGVQ